MCGALAACLLEVGSCEEQADVTTSACSPRATRSEASTKRHLKGQKTAQDSEEERGLPPVITPELESVAAFDRSLKFVHPSNQDEYRFRRFL